MIQLTCTSCKHLLSIDDAFAGGVCRCQHCGTIQTVPSQSRRSTRSASPSGTQKELYRHDARVAAPVGPGSGLDQLAEILTSSGLQQQALRAGMLRGRSPRALLPWLLGAMVLLIVVIGTILIVVSKRSADRPLPALSGGGDKIPPQRVEGEPPADHPSPVEPPNPRPGPLAVTGPNFCGVAINGETVVYLLDNGGAASDLLPAMQAACYKSIKSLGTDHRFKAMFWAAGSPSYPDQLATARATAAEELKCEDRLRKAFAQGATTIDQALQTAMQTQPDAVIIMTPKAGQLQDDFVDIVMKTRGDATTRFYTIGIDGDSSVDATVPGVLATIAEKTGGKFLNLSTIDLNR